LKKLAESIKDARREKKTSGTGFLPPWCIVGPTERWTNARWPCKKIYYRKSSPHRFLARNGKFRSGSSRTSALGNRTNDSNYKRNRPLVDLTCGSRKWIVISQKRANRSYNSESVMKVVPHDVNSQLPLLNVKIVRGTFKYIIASYNFLPSAYLIANR